MKIVFLQINLGKEQPLSKLQSYTVKNISFKLKT